MLSVVAARKDLSATPKSRSNHALVERSVRRGRFTQAQVNHERRGDSIDPVRRVMRAALQATSLATGKLASR
jgi:hypothetical protein